MAKRKIMDQFYIWLTAGSLSVILTMLAVMLFVIGIRGFSFMWPGELVELTQVDGKKKLGELVGKEDAVGEIVAKVQLKIGNRDLYGQDFTWVEQSNVKSIEVSEGAWLVERKEYGHFYGFLESKKLSDMLKNLTWDRSDHDEIGIKFKDVMGRELSIPKKDIVRAYQPNQLSFFNKISLYGSKVYELFFGEPREANTEGGLFPAIFGTVALIFVMSFFSFPVGVMAGIYLKEYASRDSWWVSWIRIAVNNLAGIPSIVYGIFGLGFFVYGIGRHMDEFFFADQLPTPTFGTGGLLWASLTLGLLTVPVVIVATEEALGTIPSGIRDASLALGATKFQTLVKVLIPMASPGIMTGLILSMSRAAGEVAPLMITGVVKLAPDLPIDGEFPFLHLDRKFMHLGFHIYDVGFQSPNVEAAKPMVFVTTLLLLGIVLVMSSGAILLRNYMKRKMTSSMI